MDTSRYVKQSVRALCEICECHFVNVFGDGAFEFVADPTCMKPLGHGTYGSCHLVTVSNSQWVIKAIPATPAIVLTLQKEIQALSVLQNVPGLQKIIGVCPSKLTLLTEYAGESLDKYLQTHTCTIGQRLQIVKQVTRTLLAVKERGWVHTDVRCENICIQNTPSGIRATLIDLGLSAQIGKFNRFPPGTKSPFYMAPEVVKNSPVTSQADVYSMGRLLQTVVGVHHLSREAQRWVSHAINPVPNLRNNMEVLARILEIRT
ncbi:calcium-dependent protein kinase 1-like [Homarus americanus]|uniref:calcium-dependent protein kinase 1-like n=2 Tax=Homarus americanus TaxID=6706 RepID=UPI001C453CB4|nr:calcium-dependent protein kinase 1-like [Homarus americanus]